MPTVSASAIIAATAEEAFSFIDDYRNIPFLQPHFTSAKLASDKEKGLGAVVALEGRFHGIPMRVRNRIIAYSFPTRLVSISEGTVLSRSTWALEQVSADPPATRVTLTLDYKFHDEVGGLLWGVGSVLWSFFNKEVQGMTDESLRRLHDFFADKAAS